jgi:PAS domain S-box-containing protein
MRDDHEEVLEYLDALLSSAPVGFALFDQDLRYVRINRALAEVNGIPVEEHLGKRIPDLLPDVPGESLEELFKAVITTGEPLLNEVVRGRTPALPEERQWLVNAYPVMTRNGEVIGLGCFVVDVTDQRQADAAVRASDARLRAALADRESLLESEKQARYEAEVANERLRTLQSITEAALAHLSLDALLKEMLDRLKRALSVDTIAILLKTENGDFLRIWASVGFTDQPVEQLTIPVGQGISGLIAATGRPLVLENIEERPGVLPPLRGVVRSLLGVPLFLGEEVVGVLHVGTIRRRKFTSHEMDLVQVVADRVALAADRARVYEREHRIAETLQRSLLPADVPTFPGVTSAVRYSPGGRGVNVGGDWYDVIALSEDKLAIVIGDVVGRGMKAASLMGQMRSALRAYALEHYPPGDVIRLLNAFVDNMSLAEMTTVVYGVYERPARTISLVCAGHPPPLLIPPDKEPIFLDGGIGPPLGIASGLPWPELHVSVEPGSTLLLYTDGLVEQRGADIAVGLERLKEAVRHPQPNVEKLCDQILTSIFGDEEDTDDDVALVALHVGDD